MTQNMVYLGQHSMCAWWTISQAELIVESFTLYILDFFFIDLFVAIDEMFVSSPHQIHMLKP